MTFDCKNFWTSAFPVHARRAIMWRIGRTQPSQNESRLMDAEAIPEVDAMRSLLVWRRTNLVLAVPLLLFSAITTIIDIVQAATIDLSAEEEASVEATEAPFAEAETKYQQVWDLYSGFGKLLMSLPALGIIIMFVFAILSSIWWTRWRRSAILLKIGWGISFAVPLIRAVFPLDFYLEKDLLEIVQSPYADLELKAAYQADRISAAFMYAIQILPLVISFPGGSIRAALRIRALLPEATLTSWILVVVAPFYSAIILLGVVVALQLAGDSLLAIGSFLLTVSPWVYFYFRKLLLATPTPQSERHLDLMQRGIGLSNIVGIALVAAWVLKFVYKFEIEIRISFIMQAIQFALVLYSRTLVTTVLFSDAFFRMTVTNWRMTENRRADDGGDRIDAMFQLIEGTISKPAKKEDNKNQRGDTGNDEKEDNQINSMDAEVSEGG